MIDMKYIALFMTLAFIAAFAQDMRNIIPPETGPVDFFQEEITLTVTDSTTRVEGAYHFRNNRNREMMMPVIFPFYVDSTTLFPQSIEAYYYDSSGSKIPIDFIEMPQRKAIRMKIPVSSNSENTWYLDYEQKIESKKAVYIITSTAAWQKPLEQATYTFVAPSGFKDIRVWPEPDTTYEKDGQIYMQCVKYDFMPSREMQISWK
jgi:hypothetical protein